MTGDRRAAPDARASSSEALVARVAGGDRSAFDELVTRHADRVYGICYRYFRNQHDAEDAAQETFLTVLRRAETFAGSSRFSTWLYRVATNACNDLARKRGRRPTTVPLDDRAVGADPDVEAALEGREVIAELRRALDQLEPTQRDAVVLHDVLGWPQAAIAARAGVALGTVKSRIHRGHARLAALLGDPSTTSPMPGEDLPEHQREPSGADRPPRKR